MRKIFVYGTLRKGGRLHSQLGDSAFRATGTIDGVLLDLGAFPGLVTGNGTVLGEVYDVSDERLAILDRVEGVHAGMYERRPVTVTSRKTGKSIKAEAYFFLEDAMIYSQGTVPSGDWLEYETGRFDEDEEDRDDWVDPIPEDDDDE